MSSPGWNRSANICAGRARGLSCTGTLRKSPGSERPGSTNDTGAAGQHSQSRSDLLPARPSVSRAEPGDHQPGKTALPDLRLRSHGMVSTKTAMAYRPLNRVCSCGTPVPRGSRIGECTRCSLTRCSRCHGDLPPERRTKLCRECKVKEKEEAFAREDRICSCSRPLFTRQDSMCGVCRQRYRLVRLAAAETMGEPLCTACLHPLQAQDRGYRTCQRCRDRGKARPRRARLVGVCPACGQATETADTFCVRCQGMREMWG